MLLLYMLPMAKGFKHQLCLVLSIILLFINRSEQLESSQTRILLRVRLLLNYPATLSSWNSTTDFCNIEPTSQVTVVCYEESITQLHIIGSKGTPLLPKNFSMYAFVKTLVKLKDLRVLTLVSLGLWGPLPGKISRLSSLEILNVTSNSLYGTFPHELSSVTSLQTLILDDNMFSGRLPEWLGSFPILTVLSLRKNLFNGSLPESFTSLVNLRVLALSHNHFYGEVPDLSSLTNLQELDLEDNAFGPRFPCLGSKLVRLVLGKNRFRSGIPSELSTYYQLEWLDLSFNRFVGPFPPSLLSLPSITYLDIADNKLTGMLFENTSCNVELEFADLSSNFLTGHLPSCLSDSKDRMSLYAHNCLATATANQNQHPLSFCHTEALAVGILPRRDKSRISKVGLAMAITGGTVGGIALVGLVFMFVKRSNEDKTNKPSTRLIAEKASTVYTSKLHSDARHMLQTMKMGALGLPAYRTFSLEELEVATKNFDTNAFMGEGSQGQMYRGSLKDGTCVAIRCLKLKKRHSTQHFMHHVELISKLRYRHLVSALGHCFECYLDDSSVSRIFLIFEYVPNGTLRSWILGQGGRSLTWGQRISAAIGIAKGIQFLHTGIVPGVYSNHLKITDILMDQNLVAKISSYNLPLLAENAGKVGHGTSSPSMDPSSSASVRYDDKGDVYDFGVILLEMILGRPSKSKNQVQILRNQLEAIMATDDETRRRASDAAVRASCSDQSLKTMMEICVRCLVKDPADRPSIEDVLWNLQFAAQVQDAWRVDSQSSDGSPVSTPEPPHFRVAFR